MSESAKNRMIVVDCLENLFVHKDFEAAKAALHPDFVTHSPGLPSGREAFTDAVKNSPLAGASAKIEHVVAEDDLVVAHLHVAGMAVVDILRVEDGLLVEHWDVKQPL
ncbi:MULTISPECIES: nuclear transport factor 2 family protein [unclassified Amycolatopsis]|uniref:nuclear transport factor 2 family protein n=1 Tax=unclassified Amycolatopsis TaxID=2618356 RepID=UPI002875FDF6|nr:MULTISPECIES: nuclear transport factor 2 family protein [unclassified Amycolatopsis]MDS0140490.1 nuclear transport factor 2 family protein [Amycolatopsis sp. 505]MDS0149495.1 nuclear transport factor 2 family protein [Amycolatopsis sp. CM201R]